MKLDAAAATTSLCKRDGIFLSASMVVNLRCERDAKEGVVEEKLPAASGAARSYYDKLLGAPATYDGTVLPVIRKAVAEFRQEIAPAKTAFQS